eukprot:c4796_g1_i1.p1 GENE.c4796_g1_i1~~c4796_g1_i1.p1  ORF type:complete len:693 (+),score=183.51 c4796_g1_i1:88-2079(+)
MTTPSNEDPLAARDLHSAQNTPELYELHHKRCGGKVRTRFPPEPNGYLHIGHAKSMNMNFQMAFDKLGVAADDRECIFRYDDTNPEKESMEYIQSLADDVAWMGWKPTRVTFTSDYFAQLYDLAIELIKRGKAYVCHQTGAEIEVCREIAKSRAKARRLGLPIPEGKYHSPYRNRSVEENLKLFEDMKKGKYEEGGASLRMKMDMESENFNMYDQVAYRIKYVAHPHAGDGWCIYPTYDYTHCIIDSIEDIEYSICTLEFETRRESYYWVLEALDLYRPKVYEFARLNISNTILSKRKLLALVMDKFMRGWDDPRMPTISGLRRRGFTAQMLNNFCTDIGVTRSVTIVMEEKLQHHARITLNDTAPRTMAVLDPLKLVITNLPADHSESVNCPDFPMAPEKGSHAVTFSQVIYIDKRDFRAEGHPDYFGLTPGGCLGLRYAFPVEFESFVTAPDGTVSEIHVKVDKEKTIKPKTWVNWVSATTAKTIEARIYNPLFTEEKVDDDLWREQLNKDSEIVYHNAVIDQSFGSPAVGSPFQFEREGYFVVDQDSTSQKLVFNRTVTLIESGLKKQENTANKGKSRKEEMEKQIAEKQKRMSLDPKDMFKAQTDLYSQFDEQGVPTHDAQGEALPKNAVKKLKKEWEKQKKLFEKDTVPENWSNVAKE